MDAWVAGSVGPYGAVLAGGQEYTGDYVDPAWTDGPTMTVPALRAFHRERMQALADAGADVLACETVPAGAEVEALLLAAADVGLPVWVSLTTVLGDDGVVRTRRGEDAAAVFATARGRRRRARGRGQLLRPGRRAGGRGGRRGGVGPAGRRLPEQRRDLGRRRRAAGSASRTSTWRRSTAGSDGGARLVGGCCRVGPDQVGELAAHLRG